MHFQFRYNSYKKWYAIILSWFYIWNYYIVMDRDMLILCDTIISWIFIQKRICIVPYHLKGQNWTVWWIFSWTIKRSTGGHCGRFLCKTQMQWFKKIGYLFRKDEKWRCCFRRNIQEPTCWGIHLLIDIIFSSLNFRKHHI